jgi:peptidoglycan/LPS O-acetylase OafA/YrhL
MKTKQIDSLTPLRGIAAILVILFHLDAVGFMFQLSPLLPGTSLLLRGYLWVDFFFVLSGFIITHVYGNRFTESIKKEAFKDYLIARFSRLYPLHFVALLFSILLYVGVFSKMPAQGGGGGGSSMAELHEWKALPFHFFWLIGFGLTKMTWNVPAWSIATEWWTYFLALPLFRFLNRGVSKRTYIVPLLCIAGLWLLVHKHEKQSLDITFDYGVLRCFLSFTVGICLYQFYKEERGAKILGSDGAFVGVALLTLLLFHFPYPAFQIPISPTAQPTMHPLVASLDSISPLVFALLILCSALNQTRIHRLLNTKPLRFLGEISFSVYLMQMFVFLIYMMGVVGWRRQYKTGDMPFSLKWGFVLAALLVEIGIAALTYRFVEKPARGLLRRLFIPAHER